MDNTNDALPPIPCPVCDGCDHDLRSGILELIENIGENLKTSAAKLLDAMEAEGDGAAEFIAAQRAFSGVRQQVDAVMEITPEIAWIKMANVR